MKNITMISLIGLVSLAGLAAETDEPCPVNVNVRGHENVEWSIGYAFHLTDRYKDLPRVLLVGDSICNGFQSEVCKQLEGRAVISYWVSSYCVTSPGYLRLLAFYLDEAKYDVIHFNNGCHSFATRSDVWQAGLRAALKLIREKQPQAKIIWATTTPNRNGAKNREVLRLNAAAAQIVSEHGAIVVNDLYAAMDRLDATHSQTEYWRDDYHFTPMAIRVQAERVAEACSKVLGPHGDLR